MIKVLEIARYFKNLPHQIAALKELDALIVKEQIKLFSGEDQTWIKLWRTNASIKDFNLPIEVWALNADGLELIKESEGCVLTPYLCPGDVWTVGYGHTGPDATKGMPITQERANQLLIQDLAYFCEEVRKLVLVPLNNNQFSALVSFSFNVGVGAFADSTLLRELNLENYLDASNQFGRWIHAGSTVLPGLVTRRDKEKRLFDLVS